MAALAGWRLRLERIKQASFWVTLLGALFLFVISSSDGLETGDVVGYNPTQPPELQFCPFFNNRAPEVQPDLKNCTWFKHNSCCRQIEIDVTFKKMKSLPGASKMCQRYVNYLMCYICSPDQHRFYMQQRLSVCEEFCDSILYHCRGAMLKGSQIGDLYTSGREFCMSRRLYVEPLSKGKCFYFNESMDTTLNNAAISRHVITLGGRLMLVLPSVMMCAFSSLIWR